MAEGLGRNRWLVWAIMLGGLSVGCRRDPYEAYASAVHRDVDQSAATLARTKARLQLTVVHGHVPIDSAGVWSRELGGAAKALRERATHFATVGPPDPAMAQEHDGLLAELTGVADTVASLGEAMAACAPNASGPRAPAPTSAASSQRRDAVTDSLAALDAQIDSEARATADSTALACRTAVGDALADLTRRISYGQDQLRWTRQRVGRTLATHGVLLGDVSLRPAPARSGR